MITNSITKAQKKVEENNFAMRKRLLEYDDVMNSQREVVYARRRNALFGDRIQVDIDNMLEDLVTAIVRRNYQMLDADSLQLDCMRALSIAPKIQDGDLGNYREEEVIDLIYDEARAYYIRKRKQLAATTLEGLKNIQATHSQVQLVEINFLEGNRRVRVVVDINKAIASEGEEVPAALEKGIMLGVIDEKWKNHLREMDELRNAVQNAVYEQKDPLLVYKFESYQIFESMLSEINEQVISLIFKAKLDVPDEGQVQKAQNVEVERDDFSRMKAKHDDAETERKRQASNQFTNTNAPESDRPLTRRERREADRGGKRK
jgi:preprotein translocase subunit SecA